MFCTCCGKKILDGCNFCPECGVKLNMNAVRGADMKNSAPLGEARNVMLITGEVKELYFYNGLYYYDKFCTRLYPIGMISMPYRNPGLNMPAFLGFGMLHMAFFSGMMKKNKK